MMSTTPQSYLIDQTQRIQLIQQSPCCIWLTGLSGAGKSTIANYVEQQLHATKHLTYVLDGDNLRQGINAGLGFTQADRSENIRRTAHVAKLMVDAGLVVIVCTISPYQNDRASARTCFDHDQFIEVFINTSIEVCIERDPKGLYKRAKNGDIKHLTGWDDPYESPLNPEIVINTSELSAVDAATRIVNYYAEYSDQSKTKLSKL